LTKNADGTYTAIISQVYQQITIYVNVYDPTDNAAIASDNTPRVWSSRGNMHVVARNVSTAQQTVRVYSLTGALIISKTLVEGDNVIPLSQGLYIVKVGDAIRKITVSQ